LGFSGKYGNRVTQRLPVSINLPGSRLVKVLMCHDYYQRRGGEDEVFEVETELLRSKGHQVVLYTVQNQSIKRSNYLQTGIRAIWNQSAYNKIQTLVQSEQPDLVHFYNTFPLISPAGYYAAKSANLPVVQSLHNYRLMCLNSTFYRSGKPCEDCLGKTLPWPGIRHSCYHGSRAQSSAVAAMTVFHRALSTWQQKVDIFLLGSTETARQKFLIAGIESSKILLKPNFAFPDPGIGSGGGRYALFVGRFDEEKGIHELLDAWDIMKQKIPLKIVGDGPLAPLVESAAKSHSQIELCGRKSLDEMYELMKMAEFIVFPSRWYEAMPRTIIDSFAVGTPVIASKTGAMRDMIEEGKSGLFFTPGNANDLAGKAAWLFNQPELACKMRTHARQSYESNYTADRNYKLIMDAYQQAARNNMA